MDTDISEGPSAEPTELEKWLFGALLEERRNLEGAGDATASCSSVDEHHYTSSTAVLPKAPLQESPHADLEGIYNAFSPNAVLGIRSLPNALAPDYRQQLFMQLLQTERQRQVALQQQRMQSHKSASSSGQQQQSPSSGSSGSRPGSFKGSFSGSIRTPHRYSPHAGCFSTFGHLTSEYERGLMMERFAKLTAKLAEVSPDSFVVRGCPLPPAHTPSFDGFSFTAPPFTEVDYLGRPICSQQQQRQFLAHGDFVPAGRSSSPEATLRGQSADMLMLLEKQMAKDWPKSFIKVFTDSEGGVVISFDRHAAAREGDISSYMNHQVRQGGTMQEYRLTRDPSRWGVVEGDGVSLFYVLHPPWCSSKPEIPEELQGPIPPWDKPPHVTHPAHGFNRNPFGTTTAAGVYLSLNTRLYEKTVDV